MGFFDFFTSSSVVPVNNDIPKPRSDASVNAPPPDQHKTVAQFIQVSIYLWLLLDIYLTG